MKKILFTLIVCSCMLPFNLSKTYAQVDIRGKLIDRANQGANEAVDESMDNSENGVRNSADKKKDDKKDKKDENGTNNDNQENNQDNQSSKSQPSLQSYSKFDFIPGDKVIFYEDFMQDAIGDFPALWNTNGSGEVTTTNLYPGNWFKMKPGAAFMPELTIPFNENFTFECDLIFRDQPSSDDAEGFDISFIKPAPDWKIGDLISDGCTVSLGGNKAASWKDGLDFFSSNDQPNDIISSGNYDKKVRVSIWVQKQRLRLYLNDLKILDLPRLLAPGLSCEKLEFSFGSNFGNALMTNVRIAIGAPDTRNKLLTTGKFVTHGITFDVNSDKIKPESYGTLKDIA